LYVEVPLLKIPFFLLLELRILLFFTIIFLSFKCMTRISAVSYELNKFFHNYISGIYRKIYIYIISHYLTMKEKMVLTLIILGLLSLTFVSAQVVDEENFRCDDEGSFNLGMEEGETRFIGGLRITLKEAKKNPEVYASISVYNLFDFSLTNENRVISFKDGENIYRFELISAPDADDEALVKLTFLDDCKEIHTQPENECKDSDGRNFDTYGEVEYELENDEDIFRDYCEGERAYDYFCDESGTYSLEFRNCPNGCSNGACLPDREYECKDSDGGLNYFERGIASGTLYDGTTRTNVEETCTVFDSAGQTDVDSCSGEGCRVKEWWCNKDTLLVDYNSDCTNGCFKGACLASTDSDERFRRATFSCLDGSRHEEGESTSCKSPSVWRDIAQDICAKECRGDECGVDGPLQFHNRCDEDKKSPELIIGEDIGEFRFLDFQRGNDCFVKNGAVCLEETGRYEKNALAGVFTHSRIFTNGQFIEQWRKILEEEEDYSEINFKRISTKSRAKNYYLITATNTEPNGQVFNVMFFTWFAGKEISGAVNTGTDVVYLALFSDEDTDEDFDDLIEPLLDAYLKRYPSNINWGGGERISETVSCVFQEPSELNKCSSKDGRFSCSGYESCRVAVVGNERDRVLWKSSCKGTAVTVIDGKDEHVLFYCGDKPEEPEETLYSSASWFCTNGLEASSVGESCRPSSVWKQLAVEYCQNSCSQPGVLLSPPTNESIIINETTTYLCGLSDFRLGEVCGTGSACLGGCMEEEVCYPIGYRRGGEFCQGEIFVEQLPAGKQCDNNFECGSNVCISGQCISPSLIERILEWFRRFLR